MAAIAFIPWRNLFKGRYAKLANAVSQAGSSLSAGALLAERADAAYAAEKWPGAMATDVVDQTRTKMWGGDLDGVEGIAGLARPKRGRLALLTLKYLGKRLLYVQRAALLGNWGWVGNNCRFGKNK